MHTGEAGVLHTSRTTDVCRPIFVPVCWAILYGTAPRLWSYRLPSDKTGDRRPRRFPCEPVKTRAGSHILTFYNIFNFIISRLGHLTRIIFWVGISVVYKVKELVHDMWRWEPGTELNCVVVDVYVVEKYTCYISMYIKYIK